jgi:hypothetical protein
MAAQSVFPGGTIMFDKRRTQIIVAFCTSCALTAFAVYQRYRPVTIPADALFVAAAIICLMPVLYGLVRRKTCPC